jgi:hypothetical protein
MLTGLPSLSNEVGSITAKRHVFSNQPVGHNYLLFFSIMQAFASDSKLHAQMIPIMRLGNVTVSWSIRRALVLENIGKSSTYNRIRGYYEKQANF